MDKDVLLREGGKTDFWKTICEALDRRILASKSRLEDEQLTNIDVIKYLRYDIRISREFKILPDILLKHAQSAAKKEER